jgi:hypothetical protein
MGAYYYAARSPKLARQIRVRWADGTEETVIALAMAYLYKPSWYSPLQRELYRTVTPTIVRLEKAWDGLRRPACAVIMHNSSKEKRPRIRCGDTVIRWAQEEAKLGVCDDPDWGHCTRHGEVIEVSSVPFDVPKRVPAWAD